MYEVHRITYTWALLLVLSGVAAARLCDVMRFIADPDTCKANRSKLISGGLFPRKWYFIGHGNAFGTQSSPYFHSTFLFTPSLYRSVTFSLPFFPGFQGGSAG